MLEETKVQGFVIKSLDYKEKDKLLELFTLEKGKITANLKGCRSQKAKLKFAGDLFNFCEFCLVQNLNKYTITNASLISSLFNITQNYEAYSSAMIILDIINKCVKDFETNPEIFVLSLKALNLLNQKETKPLLILAKYYLEILNFCGYKINFFKCFNCGSNLNGEVYFSFDVGAIVCNSCKCFYDSLISKSMLNDFCLLDNTNIEDVINLNDSQNVKSILNILNKNLELRLGVKIKSYSCLNN